MEFQKKFSLPTIVKTVAQELLIFKILPDSELKKINGNFNSNLEKLIPEKDVETLCKKLGVLLLHNLVNCYWDEDRFLEVYSFRYPQEVNYSRDRFEINEKEFSSAISVLNVSEDLRQFFKFCLKSLMIFWFLLYTIFFPETCSLESCQFYREYLHETSRIYSQDSVLSSRKGPIVVSYIFQIEKYSEHIQIQ